MTSPKYCPSLALHLLVGAALLASAALQAAEPSDSLTIYSSARPGAIPAEMYRPLPGQHYGAMHYQSLPGYAVVRHDRALTIQKGRSTQRFRDVAALLDPTTVSFRSLSDPQGTRVLEQDYQFDLVSTDKLLQRYIDKDISVEHVAGDSVQTLGGTLLSASGGLVVATADGSIVSLSDHSAIRLPALPGGLITRPTLVWELDARRGGEQDTRVSYQTGGMTWWADYNLTFAPANDPNQGELDVAAWVSIINQSGASYRDAQLKLIAGDVQRADSNAYGGRMEAMQSRKVMMADTGFEEKSFFEYHLYTLGRPTTLPDNSTKQIELFPAARGIPTEKVMVYYGLAQGFRGVFPNPMLDRNYGAQSNQKVDVYLRFRNDKKTGLGIPLPAGRIRVNQSDDADGSLEFIGEDIIDHTPRNETVLIRLGSAFDVVGERVQKDFRLDAQAKRLEEDIEIELRNHKDQAVRVIARENLYRWVNWEISEHSDAFKKEDARTIEFDVRVPANGSHKVRYTVRYSWR